MQQLPCVNSQLNSHRCFYYIIYTSHCRSHASQQVRRVGHLSQLVTVTHLVSRMEELMPGRSGKDIAVAALQVLQAQNEIDITGRGAPTTNMENMREVLTHRHMRASTCSSRQLAPCVKKSITPAQSLLDAGTKHMRMCNHQCL